MNPHITSIYRNASRCVLPIIACGMIIAGIASILKSNRAIYVGLAIVIAGLVLRGFAGGLAIGWAALATVRETGFRPFVKECTHSPTVTALLFMETLLYCLFFFGGLLLIWRITPFMK